MPSFAEIREQMWSHLRAATDEMSAERADAAVPESAMEEMRAAAERLREQQRQMAQMRVAPPRTYDPRNDRWVIAEYGAFGGFDSGVTRSPTRPPAKEPTSTTTIGDAEVIDAAYAALVADLGIHSGAVDLETFKALVPRAGLRVYVDAEVREYLHGKYKVPVGDLSPYVLWGWRPLRDVDRTPGTLDSRNGKIQRGVPAYTKPIPYPVLLTVKTIRDACPSAKFFVSDEMQGERIPDPFLLVEIGEAQFVVERWDEPAFRAKG